MHLSLEMGGRKRGGGTPIKLQYLGNKTPINRVMYHLSTSKQTKSCGNGEPWGGGEILGVIEGYRSQAG